MSKILYDFKCEDCGVMQEKLIDSTIKQLPCECGGTLVRQISTPTIALDGTDPGFPTAYDQWAVRREKQAKLERAKLEN